MMLPPIYFFVYFPFTYTFKYKTQLYSIIYKTSKELEAADVRTDSRYL